MKVRLDIPYPKVMVEEKNPYYADLLSQDYAGNDGELGAILLYSYQHFDKFKTNEELAKVLSEIAAVEMKHLELLGETIRLLGKEPIYKTCESERGNCVMWNAASLDYTTDLKELLKVDIKEETAAIKNYKHHKKLIEDKYIKALIDRILLDEERHLEIFNKLYNELCLNNKTGE